MPIALDLAGLYEQITRHYIPIPARNGESLAEQVARFLALEAKQKAHKQLLAKLANEKQFNRRVELNAAIRTLCTELNEALS